MREYTEADWPIFRDAAFESIKAEGQRYPLISEINGALSAAGIRNPFHQHDNSRSAVLAELHFQRAADQFSGQSKGEA